MENVIFSEKLPEVMTIQYNWFVCVISANNTLNAKGPKTFRMESWPPGKAQGKLLRWDLKSNDESAAQREAVGALGAGAEPAEAEPLAGP